MSLHRFIYHQLLRRHYYAITGPNRVLPDFLIIGAKRCGTTSMFFNLPKHPSILKSHHDNMGFFNDNFHLGQNWYKSFFVTKSHKKILKRNMADVFRLTPLLHIWKINLQQKTLRELNQI